MMALAHCTDIALPAHPQPGGFDHAAVHHPSARLETLETERGAHTLACDTERNKVYAFLPQTHRAAVYVDKG
jgi:hypothetical protein